VPDCTPLDITSLSNVEASPIPRRMKGPFGPQVLRGLPFHISPICFVGDDKQPVEIPVHARAHWVIFAHGLYETGLAEGGPGGQAIARYHFHFQSGSPIVVPIRERFEIAFVPPGRGAAILGIASVPGSARSPRLFDAARFRAMGVGRLPADRG
jgi:hypothetical protein